jgi:hypothetical protein
MGNFLGQAISKLTGYDLSDCCGEERDKVTKDPNGVRELE